MLKPKIPVVQALAVLLASASMGAAVAAETSLSTTPAPQSVARRSALVAVPDSAAGRVLVSAPGVRIERAAPVTNRAPRSLGLSLRTGRLDRPLICNAGERLRLQGVQMQTGSASIVLQTGCDMELVDSDVRSANIAIIVLAGARLRIENSIVHGQTGSIEAAPAAQVASWASTFIGPAALQGAEFADRGGNIWE